MKTFCVNIHDRWMDEKSSLSIWPPVFVTDIVNFLINDNPSSATKLLNDYKVGKAYEYFSSQWIGQVYYHQITADSLYCILRCNCTPSQRIKDESHKVWVCIVKQTGEVKAAYCTCTAGLGQTCNHVAGLLFKVEHANKFGYTSCTSKKCTWNVPNQGGVLEPKRIADMTIKKSRHGRTGKPRPLITPSKKNFQPVEVENELDNLSKALMNCLPSACLFKGLPDLKRQQKESSQVCNMSSHRKSVPTFDIRCYTQKYLVEKFKQEHTEDAELYSSFLTSFKPTPEIIHQINVNTVGQSSNSDWQTIREGRITASNFYAVHTKVRSVYKLQSIADKKSSVRPLLARLMGYSRTNSNIKPLKYGREMEPTAKEAFKNVYLKGHVNPSYLECGVFVDKDRPYLAASPDLLVQCDCCGTGLLEIKCPMIAKCDSCPAFCTCILPSYIHKGDNSQLTLRKCSSYYGQVQGQMAVTGRSWCDFFVYTCNGFILERIVLDEEFVSNMIISLEHFFQSYIVPELFTRTLQEEMSASDNMEVDHSVNVHSTESVYFCPLCQNVVKDGENVQSFGERSILCEACAKWFHFKCVKMTKAHLNELKGRNWLCAKCKLSA